MATRTENLIVDGLERLHITIDPAELAPIVGLGQTLRDFVDVVARFEDDDEHPLK
jgi:hypothetical protein